MDVSSIQISKPDELLRTATMRTSSVDPSAEPDDSIVQTAKFAGYLTAHAVWSLPNSRRLTCLFGFETADDSVQLDRLKERSHSQNVASAEQQLEANSGQHPRNAIVYEGYVKSGSERIDALIIKAVDHTSQTTLRFALPYQPANETGPIQFGKLKFLDADASSYHLLAQAFFSGVEQHPEASQFWADILMQSSPHQSMLMSLRLNTEQTCICLTQPIE